MTEQQYADIAAACDRLLRAPGTSVARIAIQALHFRNEHPNALAQYDSLGSTQQAPPSFDRSRALLRMIRGLTRSLLAPAASPLARQPFGAIIVSHLLRPEQLRADDDFYFGSLQRDLHDRGVKSLLVLIDHLATARTSPQPSTSDFPRIVLPKIVRPAVEAGVWRQCADASRVLRQLASAAGNELDGRLALLASRWALAASTVVNLRMHAALAAICRAANPMLVITTYEGTVAERLIWHAARTAKRRPLCVGYQHAVMLERAHAIRRPVGAGGIDCDPDVILTLGEIPHAMLATSTSLRSVPLIAYGSHRRVTMSKIPAFEHRPRRCLVLPDADHRECETLFEFALDCAQRAPDVCFVLRPHPMVSCHSLLRRIPRLRKLPANVQLSADTPLEQEMAGARYCLYRGSSAALHALRAGIKPYYLMRSGELTFDCLFELGEWRERVESPDDMVRRLQAADRTVSREAAAQAAEFCERYVSKLRPEALNELLTMVPQGRFAAHRPTLEDAGRDAARKMEPL
jgi:hypothetical protein